MIDTSIAYVNQINGQNYWAVAIDTEFEKRFSDFWEAQDYQDSLIVTLGL